MPMVYTVGFFCLKFSESTINLSIKVKKTPPFGSVILPAVANLFTSNSLFVVSFGLSRDCIRF
ncbi:hypothetical protein TUM4438_37560 [Shewanella sairae]|uniref:Uncharacterized protein n=1 Tax=Shewanella sairae TaxID=190310 RepID=A0ABQ4PPI0_9GAMM|nr:hypothetical protein TUM4438_37560 [Shewanella sairae]